MPVVTNPAFGAAHAAGEAADLLKQILAELKESKAELPVASKKTEEHFNIYKKGHMVWWQKNPDAAAYRLHLYVNDDEIDIVEVERNKTYHTFTDLVGMGMYRVEYEAEDRDGNVLDRATIEM